MNKKLALFLGVAFIGSQVALPVEASAQNSRPEAKVAVVDNLSYGDDTGSRKAAGGESALYKQAEDNTPLDRKVTIRVNNVPIGTFLNSISAQSKINFIMGDEFAGKKVSASLANVTVRKPMRVFTQLTEGQEHPSTPDSNSQEWRGYVKNVFRVKTF